MVLVYVCSACAIKYISCKSVLAVFGMLIQKDYFVGRACRKWDLNPVLEQIRFLRWRFKETRGVYFASLWYSHFAMARFIWYVLVANLFIIDCFAVSNSCLPMPQCETDQKNRFEKCTASFKTCYTRLKIPRVTIFDPRFVKPNDRRWAECGECSETCATLSETVSDYEKRRTQMKKNSRKCADKVLQFKMKDCYAASRPCLRSRNVFYPEGEKVTACRLCAVVCERYARQVTGKYNRKEKVFVRAQKCKVEAKKYCANLEIAGDTKEYEMRCSE